MELVERLTPSMRRVARMFVSTDAVADEVVQEAWVGVLQGIDAFEGRSSLRTWIFRILVNIAKTRGQREGRSVPFATLAGDDLDEPTWDPAAFDADAGTGRRLPFDWRGSARGARDRPRDARRDRPGDRGPAADAGRGDPAARRRSAGPPRRSVTLWT